MRIMVALDGSKPGEHAVEMVAAWARAAGAEAVLLTVLNPEEVHDTFRATGYVHALTPQGTASGQALRGVAAVEPIAAEDRTQALERARVEAEEYLQAQADRLLKDVITRVHVGWSDDAAQAIAEYAERSGAQLIAIGTHGRSGVSSVLLGSVAQAVIRHSTVPVLVVREGMKIPEEAAVE
jgi:nucleotide-binding universal stress UspA family protein